MSRGESAKKLEREKVFILGHDTRSFLTVIRSLGRKGLVVHVGISTKGSVALSSKYISKIHLLPSSPKEEWKAEVLKIMKQEKFDLVIPTNDGQNLLFQQFRDELEPYGRIYLLNDEVFKITYNKMETYNLCERCGVNYPKSKLLKQGDNVPSLLEPYKFPLILKPRSSVYLSDIHNKNRVKKIYDKEQFETSLKIMLQKGDVVIQDYFDGIGVGIEVLAANGIILTVFQHIRVHEPLNGGGSSYRKSMPVDKDLLDASKKLIRALKYTGVAMLEFRVNPKQANWTLIEINGRFWGSLPLAVAAGVDFPYYLYQMLVDGKQDFPADYRYNIYCRNTASDLSWIVEHLKRETFTFIGLRNIGHELLLSAVNIFCFRERNDTFVLDDPLPGIHETFNIASALSRSIIRKTTLCIRNAYPLRIYHNWRIINQLRTAKNILFICKGNICRSPFAEFYSRKVFSPSVHTRSCGYYPQLGRLCPRNAVIAGRDNDVDMKNHRSVVINDEYMDNADIVFVFDYENMSKVVSKYPRYRSKIWYLSEVTTVGLLEIPDPYGNDRSVFDKIYSQIRHNIDIIAEMQGNSQRDHLQERNIEHH